MITVHFLPIVIIHCIAWMNLSNLLTAIIDIFIYHANIKTVYIVSYSKCLWNPAELYCVANQPQTQTLSLSQACNFIPTMTFRKSESCTIFTIIVDI